MESKLVDIPLIKRKSKSKISQEEKLPALEDIIRNIEDEDDIDLEQFVRLVGKHTSDRGYVLDKVMREDLDAFRKMVVKVYDTMTEDMSDVMANEQMELAKTYEEKHSKTISKIAGKSKELKEICPDFNFDSYYKNPEEYIKKKFAVPEFPEEDSDSSNRHLAYQRLRWLQDEMSQIEDENRRLHQRLTELKNEQRRRLRNAVTEEQRLEHQHLQLVKVDHELRQRLDKLNQQVNEKIMECETKAAKQKLINANMRAKEKKKLIKRSKSAEIGKWHTADEINGNKEKYVVSSSLSSISFMS